jgi:Planctomycete cytochrome C
MKLVSKGWLGIYIVLLSGCANDHLSPAPVEICVSTGQDTISFQQDILPILVNNCATPGCHSGKAPSGDLNLESAHAHVQLSKSGSGYLNPSNPTSSVLYSQLVSISQPMPPTGQLSTCTIQLIEQWMSQGAKDN